MLRSEPMLCRRSPCSFWAGLFALSLLVMPSIGWAGPSHEPLNVVVTIPVLKDLAEQVGGPHVHVTSLLSGYENEHTYSPKPSDLIAVRNERLFFVIGVVLKQCVSKLVKT